VGTGAYDRTPIGTFEIVDKVVDPVWWKGSRAIPFGDPENILGTRWMSINVPGFGLHGTWDDSTVGSSSSAGCVRMRNADIEEVFDIVPVGTKVVIRRGTEVSS
jgi:lipoprotein-anchoring transpeptidase ErfK/SrfK